MSAGDLVARAEPESGSPSAPALASGNRRMRCPSEWESLSSEAFPDTPSFDGISDIPDTPVFDDLDLDQSSLDRQQRGPICEIGSFSSDACSAPSVYSSGRVLRPRRNATPTEWKETFRRLSEGPKRKAL